MSDMTILNPFAAFRGRKPICSRGGPRKRADYPQILHLQTYAKSLALGKLAAWFRGYALNTKHFRPVACRPVMPLARRVRVFASEVMSGRLGPVGVAVTGIGYGARSAPGIGGWIW